MPRPKTGYTHELAVGTPVDLIARGRNSFRDPPSSSSPRSASSLSGLGYRIVPTTVTDDVCSVAETTVLYEPGRLVEAQRVLTSLSGMAVLGEGMPPGGADVAVIAGTDLAVQAPSTPRAPSSAPAPSSTSTSLPTTSTTSSLPAALASNPDFSYNPPTGPIPSSLSI